MAEAIRYQIFVSSTFTDLKEERAEVLQAIWELECIPTGMEAFLATSESQWQVIQGVIDQCDYYVLIIGGRYGQITQGGISYTEKEFNYARGLGIPVLAFVHGNPENIAVSKTEKDRDSQIRLDSFRKNVMSEFPVRTWTSASELGGLVSRSLSREFRVSPRPGWVRNTGPSQAGLLERIDLLTTENNELKIKSVVSESDEDISDLQSGEDSVYLTGTAQLEHSKGDAFKDFEKSWRVVSTWSSVFRVIGYSLLSETNDAEIRNRLSSFVSQSDIDLNNFRVYAAKVDDDTVFRVITQFRALGLITKAAKRSIDDKQNYWIITNSGDKYLTKLTALKKIPI